VVGGWLTVVSSAPGEQGYVDAAKANEDTESRNAAPTHVLLDPTGEIGHLYGAVTTPHIFVIKSDGTLAYMGGADSIAPTRAEDMQKAEPYAREAIQAVAAGKPVPHPITAALWLQREIFELKQASVAPLLIRWRQSSMRD
jgi:hypothetical protein